ncbi:hypothetical protein SAMN05414137_12923 [Streptacidiphilus jiangxiensis]|uniref:N-acetyltransferase domain-containing protein n=2 Tax=Streptacidiphilus jiangxiensis TaxID=235985 RepID=A0A1H7YJF0_STRJI|nr:hypothetical protein SAMN05414137_12923 [Streptacidiphilus jiangxiensis]
MINSMLEQTLRPVLLRAAARNNADWCEAMCRAHGLRGEFRADAWSSPTRTPPYYPDAVTLTEHVDTGDLLARVDIRTPGATLKDSFAALDLHQHGWTPLFDATWIARASQPAAGTRWRRVRTEAELQDWERAWDGGVRELFRPSLLEDPSVLLLAAPGLDTGAVLSLGAGVVGVSNLFTADGVDPDRAWGECVAAAAAFCPGLTLVGYEHGPDLAVAERAGFTPLGPLRVWLRD